MSRHTALSLAALAVLGLTAAPTAAQSAASPEAPEVTRLPDGRVTRLSGTLGDPAPDARRGLATFLGEHGPRFGAGTLGAPRSVAAGLNGGRGLFVPQLVHDIELDGHGLFMRLDDQNRVVLAHGVIAAEAADLQPPTLDPTLAVLLAEPVLATLGGAPSAEPQVSFRARLTADGPRMLALVSQVRDLLPWVVELDAHSGAVLALREDTSHGGVFLWDGVEQPFATAHGKGLAYKGVKHALKGAAGGARLAHLAVENAVSGVAEAGTLLGAYTQIRDADGIMAVSPSRIYMFDDEDPTLVSGVIAEYQLFDHVNTYHWLSKVGSWYARLLGDDFGAAYAVPTFVNYDKAGSGYANAFYSPADLDGEGGLDPGYMLFGDLSEATGDPHDDFSRDPSVAAHEYNHLVVAKEGLLFGASGLDEPPRALNEALADYAAATLLRSPAIGAVLTEHSGSDLGIPGESLRSLDGDLTLADDLWAVTGHTTGLPEEHAAGELFGQLLWDLRAALKPKLADRLILTQLDTWPQSTAEVGYPVVTPGNATAAYRAYFHACVQSMVDGLDDFGPKVARLSGLVWGAAATHGLAATANADVPVIDGSDGLKWIVRSRFAGSLDEHAFDLTLTAGQRMAVVVAGVKGTRVDLALDGLDDPGDGPEDLTALVPKLVNGPGTKAVLKAVEVNTSRTYRLTVSNTDAAGGRYVVLVKVR